MKVVATTLREVHSTNRHSWSAVAWVDGKTYAAPTCELDVLDRVGGGDGFASGFFYGLLTGESPEEAVKLGWAHGALLTTFPGDTTMATRRAGAGLRQGRLGAHPALAGERLSPEPREGGSGPRARPLRPFRLPRRATPHLVRLSAWTRGGTEARMLVNPCLWACVGGGCIGATPMEPEKPHELAALRSEVESLKSRCAELEWQAAAAAPTEEALRQSEARYRCVFDAGGDLTEGLLHAPLRHHRKKGWHCVPGDDHDPHGPRGRTHGAEVRRP